MSLIKCPECGKEISTEAASCPHCGYPLHKEEGPSKSMGYPAPKSNEWTKEWGKKALIAKIGLPPSPCFARSLLSLASS